MALTLRNIKGAALTHTELDANFTSLESRIVEIETNGVVTDLSELTDTTGLLTVDYDDVTNKPDLSVYALRTEIFSGNYNDLVAKPSIPTDILQLDDTNNLLFDGDYNNLTNKPIIPSDINQLTDATNLLDHFSGSYNDLTDLPTSLTLNSITIGTRQITSISTDGTLASNSNNVLPTQQAIKTYVDSQAGGGGSLEPRTTITDFTTSLADGASGNLTLLDAPKTYVLLSIQVSDPAWVRIYTDGTSRTNDSARVQDTDPASDAGVIAEFVTTTNGETVNVAPALIGWNSDNLTEIPLAITNNSGAAAEIEVTISYIALES